MQGSSPVREPRSHVPRGPRNQNIHKISSIVTNQLKNTPFEGTDFQIQPYKQPNPQQPNAAGMPLVDSQYYPTIVISNNVILFNHYAEVQLFSLHLETELMQQPCGLIHHYSFSPVTFNSVNGAGEVHRGAVTGIRPAARGGGEQGRARNFTWV